MCQRRSYLRQRRSYLRQRTEIPESESWSSRAILRREKLCGKLTVGRKRLVKLYLRQGRIYLRQGSSLENSVLKPVFIHP